VKQYPKQNSIIHLKSNIFAPPQNFWAGYATGCDRSQSKAILGWWSLHPNSMKLSRLWLQLILAWF